MLKSRTVEILAFAAIVYVIAPQAAHAYIDIGTGSYLFQVLLGIVFGAWMSLKAMLAKRGF